MATIEAGTYYGFVGGSITYGEELTVDESAGAILAYGTYTLNKIQMGAESSHGTAVAADFVWRGPAIDITEEISRTRLGAVENVGILAPYDRSMDTASIARLSLPATELTFEQFPHVCEAAIATVATATGTGPYVYDYNFPVTSSVNTLKSYTIETGNAAAGDVNEMDYSLVESFELSGQFNEAWTMSSNWFGQQKLTTTFTAALTPPAVEEALFNKTKIYIDATGGTVGATQVTGVLTRANISVTTGIQPVSVTDGNLYFATHKFVQPEITFSLTLELENTTGVVAAERAIYVTDAVRLFRLDIDGSDATRKVRVDWAGQYDSIGNYENADGNTVVTLEGTAVYSSADSLFFEIDVTNNLSALP